jgi:3'-5' exonuclease
MRSVIFDIETIGNPKMTELLPPIEVDKRLKDPVKIEMAKAEKTAQQVERMGLDKTTALICCITTLDVETDEIKSIGLDPETLYEEELLESFWEVAHPYSRFITFNGNMFDVPMLTFRSMVNSIQPSVKISTKRYQTGNHVDVRALLGDWDSRAKGTLDYYSKILLGESKADDIDGSFVQDMWDVGAQEEIKEYNQAECRSLKAIYQKMIGFYI